MPARVKWIRTFTVMFISHATLGSDLGFPFIFVVSEATKYNAVRINRLHGRAFRILVFIVIWTFLKIVINPSFCKSQNNNTREIISSSRRRVQNLYDFNISCLIFLHISVAEAHKDSRKIYPSNIQVDKRSQDNSLDT